MKDMSYPENPVSVRQEEQQMSTKDRHNQERAVQVHHEELWQPRKDQSGPDEYIQGGQVLMTSSPVEGRSNTGCLESSPTSDAAGEQPTKKPILSREIKVSRIYGKTTPAVDLNPWRFSVGIHQKKYKDPYHGCIFPNIFY
ncbi:hypothetical protein TNCV_4975351 [Trichonephila clavipes]|uniref:Uncharacterized protein n=1 Tax=Trichonephila clavipes TaxID=2585209 RepID=A0A8X6VMJ1_TRICX|nr:hypothetical protein TNCV_4975351 [Trichonephila clavipes]